MASAPVIRYSFEVGSICFRIVLVLELTGTNSQ